jgi:hypothetical protein
MSPTPVVAAAGPATSNPQMARHQCLQLRWWPLLDLQPATPGAPPSTPPTPVVAVVGPAASTPKGPRHRGLQLRWWSLPDLPPATPKGLTIDVSSVVAAAGPTDSTPRGPAIDISLNLVHVIRIFLATPTRGATAVNITTTSKQLGGKMEARVSEKKSGPCGAKNPGITIPLQRLCQNQQTVV